MTARQAASRKPTTNRQAAPRAGAAAACRPAERAAATGYRSRGHARAARGFRRRRVACLAVVVVARVVAVCYSTTATTPEREFPVLLIASSSQGRHYRESAFWTARSFESRSGHRAHPRGACDHGRPRAAPRQINARSWERHFQRRDAIFVIALLERLQHMSLILCERL